MMFIIVNFSQQAAKQQAPKQHVQFIQRKTSFNERLKQRFLLYGFPVAGGMVTPETAVIMTAVWPRQSVTN